MDFQSLKRRDLQSLCKLNKLPANTTNVAMADSLASLPTVEGIEEYLGNLDSELQGSPERSTIAKPNGPRTTTTRQKAVKEELECSDLATRTRGRTRSKAVEGTDTRKTPATRTTRKRATQQASIQKTDSDLQAEFEADMDQSQVSENNVVPGGEIQEVAEEVSEVSVENEEPMLSESQSEPQNEVSDGQEVNDDEDHIVNDMQAEDSEMLNKNKVDFHSFSRKDLQNLCKKNNIPANKTNAAMADALESLDIVEGLQEYVNGCDSQAPSSPPVSGITSSCARRSRTSQKISKEEPHSSKLITKSCRGSRRRITEETEQEKNDVSGTLASPTTQQKAARSGSALHHIQEKESSADQRSDIITEETEQEKYDVSRTPASPTTQQKAAHSGSALHHIQEKESSADQRSDIKTMESVETAEVSCVSELNNDISSTEGLLQEAPVFESTLEDDNGKGNSVEHLKEPVELVSQTEETIVEEILESAEVSEVTDSMKVDISPEVETAEVSCISEFNNDISSSLMQEAPVIESPLEDDNGKGNSVENLNEPVELVSQTGEYIVEEEILESAEVNEVFTDLVKVDISPEVVTNCGATQEEDLKSGSGDSELENIDDQQLNSDSDADSESEDEQLDNLDNLNADDQIIKEIVSEFSAQADQSCSLETNDESKLQNCGSTQEEDPKWGSGDNELENTDDQQSLCSESDTDSESEDEQLENLDKSLCSESDADSESEDEQLENLDNINADDQMSKEIVSNSSAKVDQSSQLGNNNLEKVSTTPEDEMSEKSDSEATSQDDHLSMEVNVESEYEESHTEDEISSQKTDDQLSLDINMEYNKPEATINSATDNCVEKPEENHAESMLSTNLNLETTTQANSSARTENDLYGKSLRELKRLVKEKLEAEKLGKEMEKLTLVDTETPLAKGVEEHSQECLVESGNEEPSVMVPQTIPEDKANEDVEESEDADADADAETTKLYDVEILLDNEIASEDAVTGNINVVSCVPQSTPSKCSSSKTKKPMQMSAGRKSVSDDNKENICSSISKTEPGKIKIAVTESVDILSPTSMAKLKRDIKVLKQQSEIKKRALQSRSENLLASP
ncbi:hypothetical protein RDABS01_012985 [Bienertia sinuspersici]